MNMKKYRPESPLVHLPMINMNMMDQHKDDGPE